MVNDIRTRPLQDTALGPQAKIRELPVVGKYALNHSRGCFNVSHISEQTSILYYVKLTSTILRLLGRQSHAATDRIVPTPVLWSKCGTRHRVGF